MIEKNFMGKPSARVVLTIDENGRICNEIMGSTFDILKLTHSLIRSIKAKISVPVTLLKMVLEDAIEHEGDENVAVIDVKELLRQVKNDDC